VDGLVTYSRDLSVLAQCCTGIGPRLGLEFNPSAQRVGRRDMQPAGCTSSVSAGTPQREGHRVCSEDGL